MSDGVAARGSETCDWCPQPSVSRVATMESTGRHEFSVCERHLRASRDWDSFIEEVDDE